MRLQRFTILNDSIILFQEEHLAPLRREHELKVQQENLKAENEKLNAELEQKLQQERDKLAAQIAEKEELLARELLRTSVLQQELEAALKAAQHNEESTKEREASLQAQLNNIQLRKQELEIQLQASQPQPQRPPTSGPLNKLPGFDFDAFIVRTPAQQDKEEEDVDVAQLNPDDPRLNAEDSR